AILVVWGRTDLGYDARVQTLLEGGLLPPSAFTSNHSGNTLTGGADALDLFYGSLARDTHDRNRALGEVFVDPEAVQAGQIIDASPLGLSQVWIDGRAVSGATAALPFQLLPGDHSVGSLSGSPLTFT